VIPWYAYSGSSAAEFSLSSMNVPVKLTGAIAADGRNALLLRSLMAEGDAPG